MNQVIAMIGRVFAAKPEVDREYLDELKQHWNPEYQSIYRFLISGNLPVWDGPDRNVGWNILLTDNRYIFLSFLPSYLVAAIEIRDHGSSPAEVSDMPRILVEKLSVSRLQSAVQLETLIGNLTPIQMSTIRSVLELIACRGNSDAATATEALWGYWRGVRALEWTRSTVSK